MMHPHAVDSQLGQVRGDLLGVGVSGEIGAETQVHAPDFQPAGTGEEMAVLDMDEAVRAGRFGREPGEVGRRVGGVHAGYDKREALSSRGPMAKENNGQ